MNSMVSWKRKVMAFCPGVVVVIALFGMVFFHCTPEAQASFDIEYSRNIIVESNLDDETLLMFENVLTFRLGPWEISAITGPEWTVNTHKLRWINDLFIAKNKLTFGIHWTSEGSKRAYAMYTF